MDRSCLNMILFYFLTFLVLNHAKKGNFNDSFKFNCPAGKLYFLHIVFITLLFTLVLGEYVSHIEDGLNWNLTCSAGYNDWFYLLFVCFFLVCLVC